jgi:hypothetical protein
MKHVTRISLPARAMDPKQTDGIGFIDVMNSFLDFFAVSVDAAALAFTTLITFKAQDATPTTEV